MTCPITGIDCGFCPCGECSGHLCHPHLRIGPSLSKYKDHNGNVWEGLPEWFSFDNQPEWIVEVEVK